MLLDEYRRKRDFSTTPEPSGDDAGERTHEDTIGDNDTAAADRTRWEQLDRERRFCVQMHRATRMHFDVRLEHNGVLLSWAVPRGPSLDPTAKRLAVQTEDHPTDYGDFEGVIPSGYGMGTVLLWDIGSFEWKRESAEDVERSLAKGDVKFALRGSKIAGEFALVRIGERGKRYGGSSDAAKNWLLIKKKDAATVIGFEALALDHSVKSGRTLDQIAADGGGDPRAGRASERTRPRPTGRSDEPTGRAPRVRATPEPPLEAPPADADGNGDARLGAALARLAEMATSGRWDIGDQQVQLTNLDKPIWPEDNVTKRDMIAHYVRVSRCLLPYLRDRPLSMQIFPDGIDGHSFWRKDKPSHAPDWIESWTYHGESKTKTYILVNDVATLAWVANAGTIDLHPWHSRSDAPHQPDWAVFDLDPFPPATFADVVTVAKLVKVALDFHGMHGVVKTSGQTGLQIYVPIRRGPDYGTVRNWVERVGRAIAAAEPSLITWEWSVAKRDGRIRIDYTQNIINKTLAAPYSLRPIRGAPVSTPLHWEELDDPGLRPGRWTIATIGARLAAVGDLFGDALNGDQELPG